MTKDTDFQPLGFEFKEGLDVELENEIEDGTPPEALIAFMLIAISELLVSSVGLEPAKHEFQRLVEGTKDRMWMSSFEGSIH